MREILFRGKRVDNGEWVHGCYIETLRYNNLYWIWDGKEYIKICPETIGQYTGLNDKNGNRIFEGDIVYAVSDVIGSPYWGERMGKIVYEECAYFIEPKKPMESLYLFDECTDYTVIGNIHDNPELTRIKVTRPPQSWGYVEEVTNDGRATGTFD